MCGIVGYHITNHDRGEKQALPIAVQALRHRGPDGTGFYFSENIGLGHSRLSIIDLQTGDQPLYNEDKSLVLVVNGEFYNYRELSNELLSYGHFIRTKSDSESFLHLYEQYPIHDALNRLNGMWALALWDSKEQKLVLSRDRAGKKPLYYIYESDRFIFASEIKALLAFPEVDRQIDENSLFLYLKYGYIPAPYSIFKSIRKFPPASYGIFHNGKFTIYPYWQLSNSIDYSRTDDEWLEELTSLLDDAVKIRLVSDVPLGAFLSGGLDSSLIVSAMTKHSKIPVQTFSIGFENLSYDESAHSEFASFHLHTIHHVHRVNYDNILKLPDLITHFDEPFADASFLPTWYLCNKTRRHVTVSLSGDGADELFGGYRRYLAGKLATSYLRIPKLVRKSFFELPIMHLKAPSVYYGKSFSKKAKLFIDAVNRFEYDPAGFSNQVFSIFDILNLFPDLLPLPIQPDFPLIHHGCSQYSNLPHSMLINDFHMYLPDDILVKVDRMSMYHSLEVRCPFLDHRLIDLAYNMPLKQKIRRFKLKFILRSLAKNQLPHEITNRPKQGFMVPLDSWFRHDLKDFAYDILTDSFSIWDKKSALHILDDHLNGKIDNAIKIWTLAVLGMWLRQ